MVEYYEKCIKVLNEIWSNPIKMETPYIQKGGSGSGNFNHEGRPGNVGGSGGGGEGITLSIGQTVPKDAMVVNPNNFVSYKVDEIEPPKTGIYSEHGKELKEPSDKAKQVFDAQNKLAENPNDKASAKVLMDHYSEIYSKVPAMHDAAVYELSSRTGVSVKDLKEL